MTRCPPDLDHDVVAAVRAVRAGDVNAYAMIVERFQGSIVTVCAAILRDRQAASDLAQDVFVRAYQRLDTFDLRLPMKPWLIKIAYRLAQQGWRAQSRAKARRQALAARAVEERADAQPLEALLADERSRMLWQAVAALPTAQRTAVVLYYRENLSVNEVAEAMGVSTGTVKTHLFRARGQIEANLRAKGFSRGDGS